MSAKHTPGPWVAQGNKVYAMSDCVHHPVASTECNHTCRDEFEQEDNAYLVAAAPEMYEYIASAASNGCAEAKQIIAAIEKAEGRPCA